MDTPAPSESAVTFATTEHFTLQTARAATVAESNGRANLFLGAVSGGLVALAFVGQVTDLDSGFIAFGLVLLPVLFCIGLVTFNRVLQSAVEDLICTRRITAVDRQGAAIAVAIVVAAGIATLALLHATQLRVWRRATSD